MRKLTVILFLLSLCAPVQASALDDIPQENITMCRGLSQNVFYLAAGGAPPELLEREIKELREVYSTVGDFKPVDLNFLAQALTSRVYRELGKVKVDKLTYRQAMEDFKDETCSSALLLFWR